MSLRRLPLSLLLLTVLLTSANVARGFSSELAPGTGQIALSSRQSARCSLRRTGLADCTQGLWHDLIQSLRGTRLDPSRSHLASWFCQAIHNSAVDMRRQQTTRPLVMISIGRSDRLFKPASDSSTKQQREKDRTAIPLALSKHKRHASPENDQILHLRQIEGRSARDLAESLGLTAEQVWAREFRIKRKLQQLLRSFRVVRLPRGNLMVTQANMA